MLIRLSEKGSHSVLVSKEYAHVPRKHDITFRFSRVFNCVFLLRGSRRREDRFRRLLRVKPRPPSPLLMSGIALHRVVYIARSSVTRDYTIGMSILTPIARRYRVKETNEILSFGSRREGRLLIIRCYKMTIILVTKYLVTVSEELYSLQQVHIYRKWHTNIVAYFCTLVCTVI